MGFVGNQFQDPGTATSPVRGTEKSGYFENYMRVRVVEWKIKVAFTS